MVHTRPAERLTPRSAESSSNSWPRPSSATAPTPVARVAAGELAHIIASIEINPQWLLRQTQTNMDVSNIAAQTNHAISESIMKTWMCRGVTIDRIMERNSRATLGIEVYENPASGTRYTVSNKHSSIGSMRRASWSAPTPTRRRTGSHGSISFRRSETSPGQAPVSKKTACGDRDR